MTTTNDERRAAKKAALRAKHSSGSGASGAAQAKTAKLLRLYRISAWVVGVPLAALILVAMPMKYFGDNGTPVTVIGIAHGWLYMIYIACTALLATHRRWTLGRSVLVVLGGTVPLVSFWTEHVVHQKVKADEPGW